MRVSSMADIAEMVAGSSVANRAQPVGDETGEVVVPTYNWSAFLSPTFKKVKGIKVMQHFTLSADRPGVVCMRQQWDGPATEAVLHVGPLPQGMPPTIEPAGITRDRQAYLFRAIRPFVDFDKRDLVCPAPPIISSPAPSPSRSRSLSPCSDGSEFDEVPLIKRVKGSGHERYTAREL